MLKGILMVVGSLSLALGAIGIFLPILPTTPFLLLAAFCFARSSQRLHDYLVNHRVFGVYLSNYYHHAMTPKHKARTLAALWFGICVSVWLIGSLIPAIILPVIAGLVSVHIIRLQPRPEKAPIDAAI
ncbi:YbaN family protein [Corynebacterium sp. A21]|uniref:YbaN family protein n=1 Tax=Corynebacterium sp. A21 TaxID=3457318 RepID=UPI003FD607A8